MTSFFLGYNIATGTGLSFDASTNVISNSGVVSLQGNSGSLSLIAGTGITINGLEITNTGIVSASAGNGISVSGTNPLTITNTGVLSLQGDTGALSLTANNGISISGLDIGMSGSYDGNLTINNNGNVQIGQTISNFSSIIHWGDDSNLYGGGMVENYYGIQFLIVNKSSSTYEGLNANSYTIPFFINNAGGAYTGNNLQETIGTNAEISIRNTLDDGSGNMSIAGALSVSGEISGGSYNLAGGTGISFSGTTITNTGVLSLQGDTGALSLVAGSGIGISGLTITNDGVTSLTAGTGISLSGSTGGVTVTNTGIISLAAGNGISVSGSTITNTGVLSLQGDTGALSLTANNGISISGLGIGMSGSYSGDFNISDSLISHGNANAAPYFQAGVSGFGNGSWIETVWDNGATYGAIFGEQNDLAYIGFVNYGSTTYNGIDSNHGAFGFQVGINGSVYTLTGNGNSFALDAASSFGGTVRNTLDDGSGNMSIAGALSVSGEISGGSYNLAGGTGISFSGITITNTGVTSLTAGTGISLSATTGGITVTNSGITSLSAGDGISVSGDTISMSGSYNSNLNINGIFTANSDTTNNVNGLQIIDSAGTYANWQIGIANIGTTASDNVLYFYNGKSTNTSFYIYPNKTVATANNTLDNGSGTMIIAKNLFVNGVSGVVLGQNSTGSFAGVGKDGNTRYWLGYQESGSDDLYLRNPAPSSNLYICATDGIYTGATGVPTTVRNTLDDGSGNMNIAGVITSGNTVTYTSGSGTFTVPSGINSLKVYLIGGGGGGAGASASQFGTGGGGGCFISTEIVCKSGNSFSYSIGAGGAGGAAGNNNGSSGGNTTFGNYSAGGGGGGIASTTVSGNGGSSSSGVYTLKVNGTDGNSSFGGDSYSITSTYGYGGNPAYNSNSAGSNGTNGVIIITMT